MPATYLAGEVWNTRRTGHNSAMTHIDDNEGPLLEAFHSAVQQVAGLVTLVEMLTKAIDLSAGTALTLLNGEELPEPDAAREGLEAIAQTLLPALRAQIEVHRAGVEKNQQAYELFLAVRQMQRPGATTRRDS